MPAAVKTTVTELAGSRVRLHVEVAPAEVEGGLERKAHALGRELKLPGFRRGKVPAALVIQRVGREAVLEQAVRETLPRWYSDAVDSAGIVPIGDPEVDLGELPPPGQALEFSIEIGVLPKAVLGDYLGLEVPRREPSVGEEQIEHEVEALRERLARLERVERKAAEGDFVVVDYRGTLRSGELERGEEKGAPDSSARAFAGGEARDQLVELGAGKLIPGFESGLLGASAGETRSLAVTFPDEYAEAELAGRAADFEVTVKEVKQKQLPVVDDDLAIDLGSDGLAELRDEIRARLTEVEQARIEAEFREAALDAAVAGARIELTPELVKARAREMWERTLHALSHRGLSREAYLRIAGRGEEEILAEIEPDAERGLRREAVLSAVVAAETIEPSEQDLLAALEASAEQEGVESQKLLDDLRASGRVDELREDLSARRAVELIAENAQPISTATAHARAQLWTPGHEQERSTAGTAAPAGPGRLWTPTDQGSGS